MSHTIKIQALDTLFFRDGKPFTMGDDSFASGIFPPPPSVFHGAICSACIADNIVDLDDAQSIAESIKIEGIFYLQEEIKIGKKKGRLYKNYSEQDKEDFYSINPLLPTPLDIVKSEKSKLSFVESNLKTVLSNGTTNITTTYLERDEKLQQANSFISVENFDKYLQNTNSKFFINNDDLVQNERKIGNGLNDLRKTTEEGNLYRLNMYRLESKNTRFSFLLKVNKKPTNKWLRLGGEGKMASWSDYHSDIDIPKPQLKLSADGNIYFKLYLATPSVSTKEFGYTEEDKISGWMPDFDSFDASTLNASWKGIPMQLVTAFVGKSQYFGGYDVASKRAKIMYRGIPAGSVYYFKLNNLEQASELLEKFHGKSICSDEPLKRQGFGIAYIGSLNPKFLDNNE